MRVSFVPLLVVALVVAVASVTAGLAVLPRTPPAVPVPLPSPVTPVMPAVPVTPPVSPPPAPPAAPAPPTSQEGQLRVDVLVTFVDRVAGTSVPLAGYPLSAVGFGPGCPDVDIGPGGETREFREYCIWRRRLAAQAVRGITDAAGRFTLRQSPPPVPPGVRDPFGPPVFGLLGGGKVSAFAEFQQAAREIGFDLTKFDAHSVLREVGPRHWAIDVTLTGFRGDLPARYR